MRWLLVVALPWLTACESELQAAACDQNSACTRAICVDGRCAAVGCAVPSDCPTGTCELGRCVAIECRTLADCPGGLVCGAGLCLAPDAGYVPPPPTPDAEPPPARDAGDPEPGQDAAVPDAMAPDAAPPPTGLPGRYQLELTLNQTDCDDLDGSPGGNVRLQITEGEPLRGLLEGATNAPILLRGSAEDLGFTLATTEPATVDALVCQFALEIGFDGTRQPGGGIAGTVTWVISEPEPCEALSLNCTRTDDFFGTRID